MVGAGLGSTHRSEIVILGKRRALKPGDLFWPLRPLMQHESSTSKQRGRKSPITGRLMGTNRNESFSHASSHTFTCLPAVQSGITVISDAFQLRPGEEQAPQSESPARHRF